MHRVELKASLLHFPAFVVCFNVPNAPCGVESQDIMNALQDEAKVPNAPCGVESQLPCPARATDPLTVPNAPCGVERSERLGYRRLP